MTTCKSHVAGLDESLLRHRMHNMRTYNMMSSYTHLLLCKIIRI